MRIFTKRILGFLYEGEIIKAGEYAGCGIIKQDKVSGKKNPAHTKKSMNRIPKDFKCNTK